ncbi:MAG: ATP-binding cassette domain-containing protein [Lactobacillaceae bacterium]|jgi:energy-coupling factor transport system ATP-binding protein|nr:ATP-binding cassette domain-containing protein [Lactobacillaceae bacterium]
MNINIQNNGIVKDDKLILKNIDIQIQQGEFILFSGVSGSGKTTLINEIINQYKATIARVFQDPEQQFTMETPFMELIFLMENMKIDPNLMKSNIDNLLTEFNLLDKKNQLIQSLSGGEQQRLALAEALFINTDLIILDEPFASVDNKNKQYLFEKLISENQKGKTIIVADHNPLPYENLVDNIFVFENKTVYKMPRKNYSNFFQIYSKKTKLFSNSKIKKNQSGINIENYKIRDLLDIPDFSFFQQSNSILIGDNGSGKSTFLKSLVNLYKYQGKITNNYKNTFLAFQHASDSYLNITVKEEIDFAEKHMVNIIHIDTDYWLSKFNLKDKLNDSVYTLSGGEQKKLQILTLVIQNPDLLILDEPFAGLDIFSISNIVDLLELSNSDKIIVSHQFNYLDKLINNIVIVQHKKFETKKEVTI